jgi:acetyltransferase-like isoleucine patch superfamily enzyme/dTDP-4-dehydrorhamnose 3,5-epimerase-like enzyme
MASHTPQPGRFVHAQGLCESTCVGEGTRIWAFAHVLPGAKIGRDCNICDHVFIENDVVLGDRVTVKCGVQLWDGLRVGNDVFIGPNATFSNDKFPRSTQHQVTVLQTHIGNGASIGAGAVVLPGLRIGARAMVGAGAVVTHDVPARAIVAGNPTRIVGYAEAAGRPSEKPQAARPPTGENTSAPTSVRGVSMHRMRYVDDLRGNLTAGEFPTQVPFVPKRYFMVFDVLGKEIRGEHAHRACHQFVICVRGSMTLVVDDGQCSEQMVLNQPTVGVHVPPMIWAVQYGFSPDALLLVFASDPYDPNDYIRDYDEFLALVRH